MKIRIQGNAVRLRLSQGEVKDFGEKGMVQDSIAFGALPTESLTYILERGQTQALTASFTNHQIKITVPQEMGVAWANTDQVGIGQELPLGNGQSLKILVEKDFKCLTERPGEDESDNFPNPNLVC